MLKFFREVKGEFKHVVWPTRKQVILYTTFVIVVSIIIAYYLGLFDYIFKNILELIIS